MENGGGVVDGDYSGEKKSGEEEVSPSKVEELGKDGVDGLKVSERLEVFEEVSNVVGSRVESEDGLKMSKDENFEKNDEVGGSSMVGEFEEAVEIPSEVEEVVREELVGGEPVEVIGEQTITEKAARVDDLVDDAKDEVKAVDVVGEQSLLEKDVRDKMVVLESTGIVDKDVDIAGETEILKNVDEVNEKPVVVLERSPNGVSEHVDFDGQLSNENLENRDVTKQEVHLNGELENGNEVEAGHSNGDILHHVDENVKVNEEASFILGSALEDNERKNQAEKVEESLKNLIDLENELEDEQSKDATQEYLDLLPRRQSDSGEEKETSDNIGLEDQDDKSKELKNTSATTDTDNHVESCTGKAFLHTSPVKGTESPQISTVEKDDKDDKIQGNTSELKAENMTESQAPSGDSSVEVSNALAEEPEKKEAIDEVVKQSTTENIQQKIKGAADVPLSTVKSANPAPSTTPIPASSPSLIPARPAGLGRAAPLLEPAPRVVQPRVNGTVSPTQNQVADDPANGDAEENDETREKLQMIRVKFLRLAHRLGQTPHNVVVAQVLYRLGLAEQLRGRSGSRVAAFSFDRASAMAEQLEAAGQEPLDFSCTIMVLGKTGVGKSATINSIFDEMKFGTDAFQVGTKKVQDVVGTVQGIKVRVIDTPGLLPSWADQRNNEKILHSVKRFIQKSPPDIVLYLDRLDMQSRDFGDMPLLRTITDIFGPSIWFNAIVVLTHAASAPPEGPNGTTTSYDMFVTQRSHVVQQAIRQAAGDMRLMNPVSLVENHSACRTNRAGQRVLPNGQVWKPHLLLLSFASKILAEANMLLKLQDTPPGKPFAPRSRAPPLPFLLSNLLQSRPQLKLPQEQFGDDDDAVDDDLDESSDDESSEYDELPPFKRLTKAQLAELTGPQKKAYNAELEYREKLFMKKQLKEEKRRRKMMKKMAKELPSDYNESVEEDSGSAATVPVPVQDLNLPASFDSDNPTHRYRSLDSGNQWLVRPVLDPHGWDHDVGYEGINVENLLVVKEKIPVSLSGQVTKDKKDANLQMEVASSLKHGEGKSTTLALDMQTVGKELAYTLRSETRFINFRKNKATAGLSATYFGDALTGGVKFEDKFMHRRGQLVVAGGAIIGRGDVAYGGSLEATLRDKDYPLGRFLSTIGLSVMDWHGDLAIGWNAQSHIPIGRFTNLIGRVNLNNRGSGQVSVRLNSSEQLQISLVALIPLLSKLLGHSQSVQYGH